MLCAAPLYIGRGKVAKLGMGAGKPHRGCASCWREKGEETRCATSEGRRTDENTRFRQGGRKRGAEGGEKSRRNFRGLPCRRGKNKENRCVFGLSANDCRHLKYNSLVIKPRQILTLYNGIVNYINTRLTFPLKTLININFNVKVIFSLAHIKE